ncbi:MAG: hypothetical protein JWN07_304 [Hyphomicrobiales bacterium]|nr:hypothetical protein [Hyphomicrobiales bacterium]
MRLFSFQRPRRPDSTRVFRRFLKLLERRLVRAEAA